MDQKEFKSRIKNAIILLKDGHSMQVGELTLSSENKLSLIVTGWTNNYYLEHVTKQSALVELNGIKELFQKCYPLQVNLMTLLKIVKLNII